MFTVTPRLRLLKAAVVALSPRMLATLLQFFLVAVDLREELKAPATTPAARSHCHLSVHGTG